METCVGTTDPMESSMADCQCRECEARRHFAEELQQIKAKLAQEFGPPTWDWEDLERQDREYRERIKRDPFNGGFTER